ncbi:putative translation initiation factor eIF-2 alpha chain [Exidia glandulosa HHB12029]|uniref:Putative translation initiation factor eIF-2 alpha chain n=1 Tax=Exidia glandulosa HHB12029 TaxID=1314781 RepID=A0A165B6D3_EXIGL|nr:putative translation initiation factor eIF-2 alpha chain [Exidia glandulosa HHB12029]
MRYYEPRYPEVDELVMVQVRQIAEMGAYVKLLEYDNIEGMILLSELSRRRIRSIQKLIRVGRNEVVVVLRVDKEKGYIDLSKRRVSPEDIVKCEERYTKSKTVASIMRHVASKVAGGPVVDEHGDDEAHAASGNDEERLEALYDQFAWPLAKKYGHTYDAFKLALTEPDVVFDGLDIPPATLQHLLSTIGRRLTPHAIKMRADIEFSAFTPPTESTEAVPIKATLVAPPLCVLTTNATDKCGAVDRLERAIELIQATIEEDGGDLVVKMKPKAVSETEEMDVANLMQKASHENVEVTGDEDEEDNL